MKRFEVSLTEDASSDLEEIINYIAEHDGASRADHVLDRIEAVLKSLATFPDRGSHPKELLALGVRDYRQTFFKPYRLIYRVVDQRVYVYLIADGRRDMQSLLARRLLGGVTRRARGPPSDLRHAAYGRPGARSCGDSQTP